MNDCAKQIDEWLKTENSGREVELVMLAYQQTIDAPEYQEQYKLYQGDNASVSVMFCPLSADLYKKLDDSSNTIWDYSGHSTNTTIISALERWSKLAPKMHFWLYSAIFDNYFCPIDTITNMQYNIRLCEQYSNGGILIYQGQRYNTANATEMCTGTDWTTLKSYLASCLAKDVNADLSAETDAFMNCYYGAAASSMKKLLEGYKTWCAAAVEKEGMLGKHSSGLYVTSARDNTNAKNVWGDGDSKKALELYAYIDEAYKAIESLKTTDNTLYNTYHDRIERESLTIRYILLNVYGDTTVEPSLSDLYARAKLLGVTKLSESENFPS